MQGIENGLHWCLDMSFREDESRTVSGHAAANLAMLRRVAMSLPKRTGTKGSIRTRRMRAGWDDEYLLKVLNNLSNDKLIARTPCMAYALLLPIFLDSS